MNNAERHQTIDNMEDNRLENKKLDTLLTKIGTIYEISRIMFFYPENLYNNIQSHENGY